MKIREIMTTDVTTAELNSTLEEIATIMRHEDLGAVPILDDGELAGIVTDRDIVVRCVAEGRDPGECSAEDVLTEGLVTVSPDDDVDDAAAIMSRNQVRRLPVLQDGKLVGVVSLGDIAVKQSNDEVSGDALEEISEGVKSSSRRTPARKQVVPIQPDARTSTSARHSRQKIG